MDTNEESEIQVEQVDGTIEPITIFALILGYIIYVVNVYIFVKGSSIEAYDWLTYKNNAFMFLIFVIPTALFVLYKLRTNVVLMTYFVFGWTILWMLVIKQPEMSFAPTMFYYNFFRIIERRTVVGSCLTIPFLMYGYYCFRIFNSSKESDINT